jgi:hypothetical protein
MAAVEGIACSTRTSRCAQGTREKPFPEIPDEPIFRGSRSLGEVEVTQVRKDLAIARVLREDAPGSIRAGDHALAGVPTSRR